MKKWAHKFPKKERFTGEKERFELILCTCIKISNGTIVIGNGQGVFEKELGRKWAFKETNDLPELPTL
jgi:hypothetical protein